MYHARAAVLRHGRWVCGLASCLAAGMFPAGPLQGREIATRTASDPSPDSAEVVASDARTMLYLRGGFAY